jgi:hypothetical protein
VIICEQKEIQSLDFLFLFDHAKRKANKILAQIEINVDVMNLIIIGGTKAFAQKYNFNNSTSSKK